MDENTPLTFDEAALRSGRIRQLYHQLETRHHGEPWTKQEDMIGFLYDVGELGRLLMAAEGRWVAAEDGERQLEDKMAECLWWLFTLSERLGVDLSQAFRAKMDDLEKGLGDSLGKDR